MNMSARVQQHSAGVLNASNGRQQLEIRKRIRDLKRGIYDADTDDEVDRDLLYNTDGKGYFLSRRNRNTNHVQSARHCRKNVKISESDSE
jgi:hypothetical protein